MSAPINHTGTRFGKLTVISLAATKPRKWLCRCDCGREAIVFPENLQSGKSRTCGCAQAVDSRRFIGSRKFATPTYASWKAMLNRCERPTHKKFQHYGGRGISVCEQWHSFDSFYADMGPRPAGTTLDRINNSGNYEPGNCAWESRFHQQRNRRNNRMVTIDGRTQCLMDWATENGLRVTTIYDRLKRGWPMQRAIQTPAIRH